MGWLGKRGGVIDWWENVIFLLFYLDGSGWVERYMRMCIFSRNGFLVMGVLI